MSLVGVGFVFEWENEEKRIRLKFDLPGFPGIDISINLENF